jgi:Flagellar hook-length control protein FliK
MSSRVLLTGPARQPADPAATRRTANTARDADTSSDPTADQPDGFDAALAAATSSHRSAGPARPARNPHAQNGPKDGGQVGASQQARAAKPGIAGKPGAEVRGSDKPRDDASVAGAPGDDQIPAEPAAAQAAAAQVAVTPIQTPDAALLAAGPAAVAPAPLTPVDADKPAATAVSIGAVGAMPTTSTATAAAVVVPPGPVVAAGPVGLSATAESTAVVTVAVSESGQGLSGATKPLAGSPAQKTTTAADKAKVLDGTQQPVSATPGTTTAATQSPDGLAVVATTGTAANAAPVADAQTTAASDGSPQPQPATPTSATPLGTDLPAGTPVTALPGKPGKPGSDRRIDGDHPAGPAGMVGAAPSILGAVTAVPDTGVSATSKDAGTKATEPASGPLTAAVAAPALVITDPKTSSVAAAPPAPVTDQIAGALSQYLIGTRMLKDGTHRAVIRLAPEHLGEVTVTLDVRGGSVRIDLIAGPQAIGALRADLGDLRDQLAQSGLQLDDVSLSQSGSSSPGTGSQGSPERWNGAQSGPNPFSAGNQITKALESAGVRPIRHTDPGRLDVLI